MVSRVDAIQKAEGSALYGADISLEGMRYGAIVRSPIPCGRIQSINISHAKAQVGVEDVFVAKDLPTALFGRRVRDVPLLAVNLVRYAGEPVAVVVGTSREAVEYAADLVEVEYEEVSPVTTIDEALHATTLVHETPWSFLGAVITEDDGPNVQSVEEFGDRGILQNALRTARYIVDQTYVLPAVHQGYLEPQGTLAHFDEGVLHVWSTNKSPYRLREQLSECLSLELSQIDVHPLWLGGDFGGKGSPGVAPLASALSMKIGYPIKIFLHYNDDLFATDSRHGGRVRVRLGADGDGRLLGVGIEGEFDGGAYAGYKPIPSVNLHGVIDACVAYRTPTLHIRSSIFYTNNPPKGHMRSPGAPQATFALESAMDELAERMGVDAVALRRLNLLDDAEPNAMGETWLEHRGELVLDEVLKYKGIPGNLCEEQAEWRYGEGVAVYARALASTPTTSMRLTLGDDGVLLAEVPMPENGAGAHNVVRSMLSKGLDIAATDIQIKQVSTTELPLDPGVGGSRVTLGIAAIVAKAIDAFINRAPTQGSVLVVGDAITENHLGSYCVQLAKVLVDPRSGQYRVLEIVTGVDVGEIVNPAAHQMQLDGGTVMGFGYATMEDLMQHEGRIWAQSMGEYKLPSFADLPILSTVLVAGGKGVGEANIKSVGELSNCATAPAIANAIFDAVGVRIRRLPIGAEDLYVQLREVSE